MNYRPKPTPHPNCRCLTPVPELAKVDPKPNPMRALGRILNPIVLKPVQIMPGMGARLPVEATTARNDDYMLAAGLRLPRPTLDVPELTTEEADLLQGALATGRPTWVRVQVGTVSWTGPARVTLFAWTAGVDGHGYHRLELAFTVMPKYHDKEKVMAAQPKKPHARIKPFYVGSNNTTADWTHATLKEAVAHGEKLVREGKQDEVVIVKIVKRIRKQEAPVVIEDFRG